MIKNYDFKDLKIQRNNFSNYVIIDNKKIHYKKAELFECQFTHLLSVFLNKIGIKSVYYDYDDKTNILYCESMIKNNEKLVEFPFKSDDYFYSTYYYVLKDNLEKNNNLDILSDLYNGYFAACIFRDTDKNTGVIYDENGNIKLTPYYDFGTPLLIQDINNMGDSISDCYVNENEMNEFCKEYNICLETLQKEFEEVLNQYVIKLNNLIENHFETKIFEECVANMNPKVIENFLNFNMIDLMENDSHIYSDNSKMAIMSLFNLVYNDAVNKLKKLNYISSNVAKSK